MSIGPFDNALLQGILSARTEIAALFEPEAELEAAIRFEVALARAEAREGVISEAARDAIVESLQGFVVDPASLESGVARDGLFVPGFVNQLRARVGNPHGTQVHFGATSQDVIDTGLILRLAICVRYLAENIANVEAQLQTLESRFGANALMGVTRMQEALQITVADRLRSWRLPLHRHLTRLEELKPRLMVLQFGGATGTLDKLGNRAALVSGRLADELELGQPEDQWHAQRDGIVEFASWLSLVTGSLGKIGQDVTLMSQNRVGAIKLLAGGGSSAMPHKKNPVDAEVLVTLARYNATQLAGLHHALVHEQERSGASWTLEWMLLPQMVVAASAALVRAGQLLSNVEQIGQ